MYPALAVLQELDNEHLDLLWVGGEGGMEEDLVTRAGYRLRSLPAAGLHGVGLTALPRNLWQLVRGYFAARRLLAEFKPQALFFTGGFVAAPVALAGSRVPTLAFVPDIRPGFTLRLIARFADAMAVVADESRKYFQRRQQIQVTGYPLRSELTRWQRADAIEHFGLEAKMPTLVVFGGSKGSLSINQALLRILPQLLAEMQIIHVSGQANWAEVERAKQLLTGSAAQRYHAFPYLHGDMGAAFAAADLALCRAGASTLGELPYFGLPAILVPIAFKQHIQHVNAAYLQQKGAALILPDDQLHTHLAETVLKLMSAASRRRQMAAAMAALAKPDAARHIAALLRKLAASQGAGTA